MRVLITGGSGFIGSHLVRAVLARGWEVTVLDNFATGSAANIAGLPVRLVSVSVIHAAAVARSMEAVDSVVHLAALGSVPRSLADPMATHHANVTGTLSVLECARRAGIEHLICSSSSSVYGANTSLPNDERTWVRPVSPYAVSKLASEQYVLAYQQSFGLKTLAFRFFNVYGPRQRAGHPYAAVIPVLLTALLAGQTLPINGDGTNSRDFTYVGTVCEVLMTALDRQLTHPEPVNLAFGSDVTILDLVETMAQCTGLTPQLEFRPPRPGDVKHSQADTRTLRSLVPDVAPVSIREGIARTLTWMREHR